MTEPVNNQWLSEILIDLVWEIDSRRLQVHRDVLKIKDIYGVELDHAESLILSKLESIEQEARVAEIKAVFEQQVYSYKGSSVLLYRSEYFEQRLKELLHE